MHCSKGWQSAPPCVGKEETGDGQAHRVKALACIAGYYDLRCAEDSLAETKGPRILPRNDASTIRKQPAYLSITMTCS